ncbi:hypothetical protein QN277_029384 [Acacia crassicarpa]|uniref:Uncharacterized protein n=1 Tax=Acacia crassicarpa TaxID=499986 RepID=A0AAE1J8R4_9FABA|nr:hypothetical protein QN277_029384 [Acacia crassicarpa]
MKFISRINFLKRRKSRILNQDNKSQDEGGLSTLPSLTTYSAVAIATFLPLARHLSHRDTLYSLLFVTKLRKLAACCDIPEKRLQDYGTFQVLKRQIPSSNFKSESDPKNEDVVLPADDPFPPKLNIPHCDDQRQTTARLEPTNSHVYADDEDPFMRLKLRRAASSVSDYTGDYTDMPSHPLLLKILQKQDAMHSQYIYMAYFANLRLCFFFGPSDEG